MALRPDRGGSKSLFGLGWFVRELLLGQGPYGVPRIDPNVGATQADINHWYHEACAMAEADQKTEKIVSDLVLSGVDVTTEEADSILTRELNKIPRKSRHTRYHSFLMYFGVHKRLGWVEATGQTESSAIQDNYPPAPARTYYRLTQKGIQATEVMWSNPLFTLYPDVGRRHQAKPR